MKQKSEPGASGVPYRPANGTEGDMFMADWCERCAHYKECRLIVHSMAYEIDDPQYPKEWISNQDGSEPRCTAFEAQRPNN